MFLHKLLVDPKKRTGHNFVTYGRVAPKEFLSMIEMDIKYFRIHGTRKNALLEHNWIFSLEWLSQMQFML